LAIELVEEFANFVFDSLPIFFVEAWAEAVWPMTGISVHLKEGVSKFILSKQLD
jgi:hypothetical protein